MQEEGKKKKKSCVQWRPKARGVPRRSLHQPASLRLPFSLHLLDEMLGEFLFSSASLPLRFSLHLLDEMLGEVLVHTESRHFLLPKDRPQRRVAEDFAPVAGVLQVLALDVLPQCFDRPGPRDAVLAHERRQLGGDAPRRVVGRLLFLLAGRSGGGRLPFFLLSLHAALAWRPPPSARSRRPIAPLNLRRSSYDRQGPCSS
mmetsp:Transcript_20636/g.45853  ORF Transcript_20636/g.45853 Transcript_20636/m.45853 type:complete len:201 (-) Transcript_20636:8-610(-)